MHELIPEEAVQADVGVNVRLFRIKGGMSQQDLADLCRLTRSSIANVEAGRQNITITALAGIAAALGVTPADLLTKATDRDFAHAALIQEAGDAMRELVESRDRVRAEMRRCAEVLDAGERRMKEAGGHE